MIAMFSTAGSGHAVFFLARLVGQSVRSPREGSAPVRAAATRIHRARTAGVLRTPGLPIETCNFFYFVSMIPEYLMNRINGVMVHIRQRQPSVNGIRVIHLQ